MVFNLIFHLVWYTLKALQAVMRQVRSSESDQETAQPLETTRLPAHGDIQKLFLTFALSFAAVHRLAATAVAPSAGGDRAAREAQTCLEKDENNFFCFEHPKEARRKARRTAQYYLQNFGVAQTINGNGDENRRMRDRADGMEEYFRKWIEINGHSKELKEKWYVGEGGAFVLLLLCSRVAHRFWCHRQHKQTRQVRLLGLHKGMHEKPGEESIRTVSHFLFFVGSDDCTEMLMYPVGILRPIKSGLHGEQLYAGMSKM